MGSAEQALGAAQAGKASSRARAFVGILVATVYADGEVAAEEAEGLMYILARMKMFESWSENQISDLINFFLAAVEKNGIDQVLEACIEALPNGLHETVFINACDLVLADGILHDDEKQFLEKLRKLLRVDAERARKFAEFISIKNRG